jgi:hypothetical protein
VLAILACIVLLAVIGLGFYGLKSRTGWLRIQAGVWRLVTFSIEIGQGSNPSLPKEPRQLETRRDSSQASADIEQDGAAALPGLATGRPRLPWKLVSSSA